MPNLDVRYAKSDRFTSRTMDGATVLIPAGDLDELDDLYPLNKTASRVWALIDVRTPLEQIASKIAEEFDIPLKQAQDDVADFIRRLEEIDAVIPLRGE